MLIDHTNLHAKEYRNIFIVQNRDFWQVCPFEYDKDKDLVLSFDFGLVNYVIGEGGDAGYIEHLCESNEMEKYNYETYKFFGSWYKDKEGDDIFKYKDIGISSVFRIEIWNILTYYPRLLLNILKIVKLKYQNLYVGVSDKQLLKVLEKVVAKYKKWSFNGQLKFHEYYLPVFRWMNESIYGKDKNIKDRIKSVIAFMLDCFLSVFDCFVALFKRERFVFVCYYFPTHRIIERLLRDKKCIIVGVSYWRKSWYRLRRIPGTMADKKYLAAADRLIKRFLEEKTVEWKVEGINIGEMEYEAILEVIEKSLPNHLKMLDSIINYFKNKDLRMIVTIGNVGIVNCLVMSYCKKKKIPRYMIINGLQTSSYLDEAKDADYFNSYSVSVKENYFKGMDNVFTFGDPRMDVYFNVKRDINRHYPTIAIGASGFSNADLNSYTAVEFTFIYDVSSALQNIIQQGKKMNIVIKVRGNGYIKQYQRFVEEYFGGMNIKIYDNIPIKEVLDKTDYYISTYSQTLFEAACMGIPVLYYKNDTELNHQPFDGNSELVTALNYNELVQKIKLFYEEDSIYNAFLNKRVIEKYIGYLDGRNLERNIDFIYSKILNKEDASKSDGLSVNFS